MLLLLAHYALIAEYSPLMVLFLVFVLLVLSSIRDSQTGRNHTVVHVVDE